MSYMRFPHYIFKTDNTIFLPKELDLNIFDELVIMRYNEMTKKEIKKVEKRALKNHYGNFGCDKLAKKYNKLSVMELTDKLLRERRKNDKRNTKKS